jgi:hypothetical protein
LTIQQQEQQKQQHQMLAAQQVRRKGLGYKHSSHELL